MNRVLIVDDDPTIIDFLKLLLESEGYETEDAADGETAIQKTEEFKPEIVLLDYKLPGMNGLEFLRKAHEDHPTLRVVVLTGKGSEEVAVECMKAGAVDYIVKPFENERLLNVIREALSNRR